MSKRWRHFSRSLVAERGFRCEHCHIHQDELPNKKHPYLEVHHKIKLRDDYSLKFEKSNLLVLCQKCHVEAEKTSAIMSLFIAEEHELERPRPSPRNQTMA